MLIARYKFELGSEQREQLGRKLIRCAGVARINRKTFSEISLPLAGGFRKATS